MQRPNRRLTTDPVSAQTCHRLWAPSVVPFFVTLVLLSLLLPRPSSAQHYTFDTYKQAQGLRDNQVEAMAIDKQGFLWVATSNGVDCFLGSKFEHFGPEQGLSDRQINDVLVDDAGRIWAATASGLFVLRGGRFAALGGPPLFFQEGRRMVALPHDRLLVLNETELLEIQVDKSGRLVSSTSVFSPLQRKALPIVDDVHSLAIAADGTLWFTCGAAICSRAQGEILVFGPGQGVPKGRWRNLYIDHLGSVWATGAEVLELIRGTSFFQDRSPPRRNTGRFSPWLPIVEDRFGRILIASAAEILRRENSSWQRIGAANGLQGGPITSMLNEPNGDLWIGRLDGLCRWTGYEHWEGWTVRQGLPHDGIWSISTRSEPILVGTIDGPALIDGSRRQAVSLSFGRRWTYGQVGGIARDHQGTIWAGTFYGDILKIDQQRRTIQRVARLPAMVRRIFVSGDGRVWISTLAHGVFVVNNPQSRSASVQHADEADIILKSGDKLAAPEKAELVSAGNQDDVNGDLFFISGHSLLRYGSGTWAQVQLVGINANAVVMKEASVGPDRSLWVTGEDELHHAAVWHLQPAAKGMHAVSLALPSSVLGLVPYSILADREGRLWIGTDDGLIGWDGTTWRVFTQEGGLVDNDTNRGVLNQSFDGTIWVGTSRGLAHLIHVEGAFSPVILSAKILRVERGREILNTGEAAKLTWARDDLRFDFASPETRNRTTLSFWYRLLGLDPSWKSTQEMVTSFFNLPPGEYRFQVFAENPDISAHSATVEMAFSILPPWWRTIWFYSICGVTGVVLLWLMHWLRTRVLLSRHVARALERSNIVTQERAHMAREIHDKLAQGYAAILMQQRALRRVMNTDSEAGMQHLDMIERLSKENIAEARKTMADLWPDPHMSGDLGRALKGCLQPFNHEPEFQVTLEVNTDLPVISRHFENEVCRVVGEALNNARKHARTSSASVNVQRVDGNLCICVRDHGVGFSTNAESLSFGLATMYERTARIGSELKIISAPGCGTSVVMTLKL
jgi:signal transduction histidine kinase/ligand-binding sensor domain-containing protein